MRHFVKTLALGLAVSVAPQAWALQESGADDATPLDPLGVPVEMDQAAAREALDRSLDFLVSTQLEDGSWGSGALEGLSEFGFSVETYYAWQVASHGIATMALLEADSTPEREAALEKAVGWLSGARMPKRGSNWDTDYTWSGLYGLVATSRVASDPRFADGDVAEAIDARGREFWRILATTEVPSGGWAYYDDPPYAMRPNWATSFCTALILPSLERAERLGWIEDESHLKRGITALQRCALPNGAYTYNASSAIPRSGAGESINNVKGSLGRIQVAHWALGTLGDPSITPERLRWGLEQFFEHHKFLDAAYMRPVPHEAYYANAAYFYLFAHYYAAEAIDLLPREEREGYHARLRPHLIKVQRADGSSVDFLGTSYLVTAGTGYTALALQKGLPQRD
ncbi:MAG: prenyltransferase/squalene oxidase repeat-containing protein [Planctomycetota bacterium]